MDEWELEDQPRQQSELLSFRQQLPLLNTPSVDPEYSSSSVRPIPIVASSSVRPIPIVASSSVRPIPIVASSSVRPIPVVASSSVRPIPVVASSSVPAHTQKRKRVTLSEDEKKQKEHQQQMEVEKKRREQHQRKMEAQRKRRAMVSRELEAQQYYERHKQEHKEKVRKRHQQKKKKPVPNIVPKNIEPSLVNPQIIAGGVTLAELKEEPAENKGPLVALVQDDQRQQITLPAHHPPLRFEDYPERHTNTVMILRANSYAEIESYTYNRLEWMQVVDLHLRKVSLNSCWGDLPLTNPTMIGVGSYGKVMKANLESLPGSYPLAVKQVNVNVADLTTVWREIYAMTHVNALVRLNICPNFPLLFVPFLCNQPREPLSLLLVQEFSNADVFHWMRNMSKTNQQITTETFMSLIFQVCAGTLASMVFLDLVNNDLKLDNILMDSIEPDMTFTYNIFDQTYTVATQGFLFKVADYGISSGTLLQIAHDKFAQSSTSTKYQITAHNYEEFLDPTQPEKFTTHILHVRNQQNQLFAAYNRDWILFFMTLLRYGVYGRLQIPATWLTHQLKILLSKPLHNVKDVLDMFHYMFHPHTLNQNGLSAELFQRQASAHNQVFTMTNLHENKPVREVIHTTAKSRLMSVVSVA